jgi:hypothetical protein
MDDAVGRLEQLAALHEKGALTDEEFARAKASVLNAEGPSGSLPEPAAVLATPSPTISRGTRSSAVRRRVRHDETKGLWRQGWVIVVAIFLGFMYMTVGTAVVSSSALWTGRFLCDSGYHLVNNVQSFSYGTTSGSTVSFACVNGRIAHSASSVEIAGLQWVLGSLVAYVVILLIAGLMRLARSA